MLECPGKALAKYLLLKNQRRNVNEGRIDEVRKALSVVLWREIVGLSAPGAPQMSHDGSLSSCHGPHASDPWPRSWIVSGFLDSRQAGTVI